MANARKGWRTIKVLTQDEAHAIRVRELDGASASHAEIGAQAHATEYKRRADALRAKGHDVGPRCGALPAVDGVWRDGRWMARNTR